MGNKGYLLTSKIPLFLIAIRMVSEGPTYQLFIGFLTGN